MLEGGYRSRARLVRFRLASGSVSRVLFGRPQSSSLTLLTPTGQKCQKFGHGTAHKIYPLRFRLTFLTGYRQKRQSSSGQQSYAVWQVASLLLPRASSASPNHHTTS